MHRARKRGTFKSAINLKKDWVNRIRFSSPADRLPAGCVEDERRIKNTPTDSHSVRHRQMVHSIATECTAGLFPDEQSQGAKECRDRRRLTRCWVTLLSPRQETFRHAATAGRNDPACVTDRCDRCDRRVDESSSVINHLPTRSQREPDPPAPGGFFVSESTKGRAPSLCSLCSLRIDGGAAHL